MEKPDNVADNPGLLPYGSNVGAPSINIGNIEHWKEPRILSLNKQFEDKFLELKKEYDKLIDDYKWNELVYSSKFNFEPVIGKVYHLYYSKDKSVFLSLVEPHEWNREHIGSFRYGHDSKWVKILKD